MEQARIETLWGVRKGESTPELMAAWDEYTVDGYRDGWRNECQEAIASWGDDLDVYRYIELVVDMDRIQQAFEPVPIPVVSHRSKGGSDGA